MVFFVTMQTANSDAVCRHRIKRILQAYRDSIDASQSSSMLSDSQSDARRSTLDSSDNYTAGDSDKFIVESRNCTKKRVVERHDCRKRRKMNPAPEPCSELSTTVIDGQHIACFIVAGEPRLCFPQVLHRVLDGFSANTIDMACSRLGVHLTRCTAEQLTSLHNAEVLPVAVTSCGLIRASDAARLTSVLLERNVVTAYDFLLAMNDPLPVCHSCFGGCEGVLSTRLYVSPRSQCIRCDHCAAILSPEQFVSHSHRLDAESRATCHWGFDATRWRHYLMVTASDAEQNYKHQTALDEVKQRFAGHQSDESKVVGQQWTAYDDRLVESTCKEIISQQFDQNEFSATPPHLKTGTPVLASSRRSPLTADILWRDVLLAPNVSLAANKLTRRRHWNVMNVKVEPMTVDEECQAQELAEESPSVHSDQQTYSSCSPTEDSWETDSVSSDRLQTESRDEFDDVIKEKISRYFDSQFDVLRLVLGDRVDQTAMTRQELVEHFMSTHAVYVRLERSLTRLQFLLDEELRRTWTLLNEKSETATMLSG